MRKLTSSIFFAVLLMFGFTSTTNAQGSQFGVNLRTGAPVGDFGDYAGFGLGGGLEYNYLFNENFGLGVDIGYMTFLENELSDYVTGSSVIIPMVVNARYTFGEEGFRPFIGVGAGYSVVQQTTTVRGIPDDPDFFVRDFDESYSGVTITPHLGFAMEMNETTSLFIKADYTMILTEAEMPATGEGGDPITGDREVVVLEPYSYIGINFGMVYTYGE